MIAVANASILGAPAATPARLRIFNLTVTIPGEDPFPLPALAPDAATAIMDASERFGPCKVFVKAR